MAHLLDDLKFEDAATHFGDLRVARLPEDLLAPLYTAFHEAGHAVAYLTLGQPFRYITMRPRPRGAELGKVVVRPRPIDPYIKSIITVAGPAAERHLFYLNDDRGVEWRALLDYVEYEDSVTVPSNAWDLPTEELARTAVEMEFGCVTPLVAAGELAQAASLATGARSFQEVVQWATRLVSDHWAPIRELAAVLDQSPRRLSQADCQLITGIR